MPRTRALALMVCLVLGWQGEARASCPSEGLNVYPRPGAVIPTNGQFILEGLGEEQVRVQALVGKKLRLVSDEDAVTVSVEKGWMSALGRVAVVLKPKTRLLPDRRYTLALGEAMPGHVVLNGQREDGVARWYTGKGPDLHPPRWVKKPAPAGAVMPARVSGDGKNPIPGLIRFTLQLEDESPVHLVIGLRRARGPTGIQSYFVPVTGEEALVGHDGCNGGFAYEEGRAYRARIQAWDLAGNEAPQLPLIEFHAPKQETR